MGFLGSSAARVAILFGILLEHSPLFGIQYSFLPYGAAEGLQNQSVTCLLEDRRGFIWVGTENGLFRYEGLHFTRFDSATGLPDNTIQSIYETPDGELWIGTRVGLARLEGDRFLPDKQLGSVALFGNSNLASDANGQFYVGTARGLAIGRRSKGLETYNFRFVTHDAVNAIELLGDGSVLISARNEVWKYQNGALSSLTELWRLPHSQWESLLTDHKGNLWLRSSRELVLVPVNGEHFEVKNDVPYSAESGTLYESSDGHVFVPTDRGLFLYNEDRRERIGTETGLPANATNCVLQDHEGSIWIGLRGTGLARWIGFGTWEGWKSIDGLGSDLVWDVKRDSTGALLVATNNGLSALDPRTRRFRSWPENINTQNLNVRCILDDQLDESVWFGAKPGGLFRYDRKTKRLSHYGLSSGLASDQINYLTWDREHHLWISTEAGLFRGTFSQKQFHFDRPDLPFTNPQEIFNGSVVDHNGKFWVAGSNGLLSLEANGWRRYSRADGLAAAAVSQVIETPDGDMWVTYLSNSGISRIRARNGQTSLQHITTANGLASDGSVVLGVDSRKWLWVGSDIGMDVFGEGQHTHFGRSDGLIWDDVDAVAFYPDDDGSVWIGTSLGLSHFQPMRSVFSSGPPNTYITSLRAGQHKEDPRRYFSAGYPDRDISFTFASSSHLNESAIEFRRRLVGYDNGWVETRQRAASYPNLPPGNYTFEVLSKNATGVWSRLPARASFRVLAPWWATWPVRLAMVCGVFGLIICVWRIRVRTLLSQQAKLEELLREAHIAHQLKTEALDRVLKAEAQQRSRGKVLELVGSRAPLATTLEALLDMMELHRPGIHCAIFQGDRRRGPLRGDPHGVGQRLVASRGLPDSLLDGLNGPVSIETPEYSKLVCGAHLHTVYAGAITSSAGSTVGTLIIYGDSTREQSHDPGALVREAVRVLGIAMENLDLYEQLTHRAQFDGLTELPNRMLFNDRLQQTARKAKTNETSFAVAWLDLDGFKHVNDTLGHEAGDALLRETAARLSRCMLSADTVARVGGDEFTLLLSHLESRERLVSKIDEVLNCLAAPIEIKGRQIAVSASIGVSVFPDDSTDPEQLVKNADVAMYQAKRIGKNASVFFNSELAHLEAARIELEAELRQARSRGEFQLHYQPILDSGHEIRCVEALIRWTHPVLGAVPPSRFIPVAEAAGLIIPLGQWVLLEACRQAADWVASGTAKSRIAVNVSAAQFARADFGATVWSILRETGLPPEYLELELTETALVSDLANSSAQLQEIQRMGIRVAIDDFGTGYSSLSYLHKLPVDTLKIDRSFVQGLETDRSTQTMVKAIANLAHDLGLKVVAEGVETQAQLAWLQAMGCDLFQGYYFSPPVARRTLLELMAEWGSAQQMASTDLLTVV